MAIKKTLGGDRLGAGKKIKVDMHGWGRSTFNQSRVWRSTMAPGVLTPCFTEVGLNGTTFEIDINTLGHTLPTIAPLFGSFKLQVDFFACPIRLYQGLLHNNMLEIGLNMNKVLLPTITIPTKKEGENLTVIPEATCTSSLINFLGIKGITEEKNEFNAVPILAYYDIFKNYYCNKQEEYAKVIGNKFEEIIETPKGTITTSDSTEENLLFQNISNNTQNVYSFTNNIESLNLENTNYKKELKLNFNEDIKNFNWLKLVLQDETGGYTTSVEVEINTKSIQDKEYLLSYVSDIENPNQLYNIGIYIINGNELTISFRQNIDKELSVIAVGWDARKTKMIIHDFPTANLDEARKKILARTNYLQKTEIGENKEINFLPYTTNTQNDDYIPLKQRELNGLLLKTYQNDIFNTWLSTEYVETINNLSSISPNPTTGEITIDAIILAKKVYNVLNRIAISGGTYEDWQESVYGEKAITRQESPLYIGGTSAEITFEEVVSTSQSSMNGVNQPLATLGGKGIMTDRKGGKVVYKCNEPCFIIGIASITPRIDYHQGNKWYMTDIFSMDNFHKPEFDGIGFQNIIENNVHWKGSPSKGLAKQTAWINYQTAVNEVFGYFAKNEEDDENSLAFMTLRRNYEVNEDGEITDFTSYIDPSKFNYAFAEPSLTAQNFWIQLGFNVESRRKMAAYEIPNL